MVVNRQTLSFFLQFSRFASSMRRESAAHDKSLSLGLMAKFWEAGKVKTRLGATIGLARAAEIHRIFVAHLCTAHANTGEHRQIAISPYERYDDVASMLSSQPGGTRWEIVDQGTGDLGERMLRWFSESLIDAESAAILIGADCPTVRPELIELAGQMLQQQDVVVGPARDGGYYLIGLSGPWTGREAQLSALFQDIPWSTSGVLHATRIRANESGLSLAELETAEDVDTIAELNRLLSRLDTEDSELKSAIDAILKDPNLAESP